MSGGLQGKHVHATHIPAHSIWNIEHHPKNVLVLPKRRVFKYSTRSVDIFYFCLSDFIPDLLLGLADCHAIISLKQCKDCFASGLSGMKLWVKKPYCCWLLYLLDTPWNHSNKG